MVTSIVDSLLTKEFLEYMALTHLIQESGPWVVEMLSNKLFKEGLKDAIITLMTNSMTIIADAGIYVGQSMATNILGRQLVENAARVSAEAAIRQGVEMTVETIVALSGTLLGMTEILQLVGLILDASDAAGLNEEMGQSILDMTRNQFYGYYNSNKDNIANGVYYPFEVYPTGTPAFLKPIYETDGIVKQLKYSAEYLASLRVNSDGNDIIRKFTPPSLQNQDYEHEKNGINSFLWSISAGNNAVFRRLQDWWWVLMVIILVIVAIILVSVLLTDPKIKAKTFSKNMATNNKYNR